MVHESYIRSFTPGVEPNSQAGPPSSKLRVRGTFRCPALPACDADAGSASLLLPEGFVFCLGGLPMCVLYKMYPINLITSLLYIYLYIYLSIHPSIHLSIYLSV